MAVLPLGKGGGHMATLGLRAMAAPGTPLGSSSSLGSVSYLEADGHIDPAPKGGAHSTRRQTQVLEKLGEGLCERNAGPLLCHHHAGSHTGQVHTLHLRSRQEGPEGTEPGGVLRGWDLEGS